MKKIRLTETELIKLVQKIISEQPTNANLAQQQSANRNTNIQRAAQGVPAPGTFAPKPPLNTGSYTPMWSKEAMRSDVDVFNQMHGRQPSNLTMLQPGQTITLGQNLFATGKDWINKNSQEFKTALGALVNLPQGTNVKVTGGASAVGSSRGYDNKALAMRRANNMINALKETQKVNHVNFTPEGVVGKNTQYNSPGAKAEQFVKLTREQKTNVAISRPAIDNTQNTMNYPKFTLPSNNPNKGTLRRDNSGFGPRTVNEDKIKDVVRQNLIDEIKKQKNN